MFLWNKFTLFISFLLSSSVKQIHSHNGTLYVTHILFRHGDRTPQRTYPNDIYKDYDYWPYGLGELTNNGKLRMYNMGTYLRNRYKAFLGELYNQSKIEAMSSPFSRTRMSCELVMAGMFPPSLHEQWNNELNWQPTICNYADSKEDDILVIENCKAFMALKAAEVEKDSAMGEFKKYGALFNSLRNHTGMEFSEPADVTALHDILRCQNEMGLSLPEWSLDTFPYPMVNVSLLNWAYFNRNDKLLKLSGGIILKKIMDDTYKKINQTIGYQDKKIFLYSGHDSNIIPILQILNIYSSKILSYGATIIFEVHSIDYEFIVKIFYQNHERWYPRFMDLPDCENPCSLKKFISAYQKYFATKKDCFELEP